MVSSDSLFLFVMKSYILVSIDRHECYKILVRQKKIKKGFLFTEIVPHVFSKV